MITAETSRIAEALVGRALDRRNFQGVLCAFSEPQPICLSGKCDSCGRTNCNSRQGDRGAVELYERPEQFLTVAHLWAAWSIREGKFTQHPEAGYDGFADFQAFLTEAEMLRDWGQNWRQARKKARPPLPSDVWRVPDGRLPPQGLPGWPVICIPIMSLPNDLLADLRPVPAL